MINACRKYLMFSPHHLPQTPFYIFILRRSNSFVFVFAQAVRPRICDYDVIKERDDARSLEIKVAEIQRSQPSSLEYEMLQTNVREARKKERDLVIRSFLFFLCD